MSGSFGMGDGLRDQSTVRAIAETQVSDARRQRPHAVDAGGWPRGVSVIRVILALLGAIVLAGWTLTALNGGA